MAITERAAACVNPSLWINQFCGCDNDRILMSMVTLFDNTPPGVTFTTDDACLNNRPIEFIQVRCRRRM